MFRGGSRSKTVSDTRSRIDIQSYAPKVALVTVSIPHSLIFAWNGRFLVIGFPAGIPAIPLNLALLKSCDIAGVFWGAWTEREPRAHQQNMLELLSLFDSGKIAPHICAVYSLEEGWRALADLAARRAQGKVVIRCG
jgi:NADPH:quinone reductase-like Zn-dependent oxidoreductase